MDETFIKNVFSTVSGETVNVKVIRDRASGYVPNGTLVANLSRNWPILERFANIGSTEMPATASSSSPTPMPLPRL